MLYSADRGVRWNTPALGRLTPLSADGRSSARTLKSCLRLLNGSSANSASSRRFTSAWNFGNCSLVYPSLMTSRSTLSAGDPFWNTVQTVPAEGLSVEGLTNREFGSTSVDQIGAKVLSVCRRCSLTRTGCEGHGNRTDS